MRIKIKEHEFWYGGCTTWGTAMPLHAQSTACLALQPNATPNQGMPLLVSSLGRYLWLDGVEQVRIQDGYIIWDDPCNAPPPAAAVEELPPLAEQTLRHAYQKAAAAHFPPSGQMPAAELFSAPVFNTWIELTFYQNQADILRYAQGILAAGFEPGVLMIDDGWSECYGEWKFHSGCFPDPAGMLEQLHAMGFKVMLWVCPYVTPDSKAYRRAEKEHALFTDADGASCVVRWWNGCSAAVDLCSAQGRNWLKSQLDELCALGVDGFKFDGGDPTHYLHACHNGKRVDPNEVCRLWAQFGQQYPFNEFRSTWKAAGLPLMQRLCDKDHSWGSTGIAALLPDLLNQGITGHPFGCADMVGGGEYLNFQANSERLDPELFLKHSAVSCLTPAIQYSAAPWRILEPAQLQIILNQLALRKQMQGRIDRLLRQAAEDGEPIVRYMEYQFPHQGMETVTDQFMLGDTILVAPILEKGRRARRVILPQGNWLWNGAPVSGGRSVELEAPDTYVIVLEAEQS